MTFFNFFRNLFGKKETEEPHRNGFDDYDSGGHNFRNPIWQNDDDDNDDNDFRHPNATIHFSVFSDPLEITRYFESQIDQMLKNWFSGFDNPMLNRFPDDFNPNLPLMPPRIGGSLRNKLLKPGYDLPKDSDNQTEKMDVDLDGKVTRRNFLKIWDNYENENNQQDVPYQQPQYFRQSVGKQFVYRSDQSTEKRQIIKDNEGNEETIISRQMGDKKYVVTVKKDKNGLETRTEELINMDENELKDFNKKWGSNSGEDINNSSKILNYFPWKKFFEPYPKL